jgi:hypothetical protein
MCGSGVGWQAEHDQFSVKKQIDFLKSTLQKIFLFDHYFSVASKLIKYSNDFCKLETEKAEANV